MSDKCTDPDCKAVISFPKKWRALKGKDVEVMTGRCPDCGEDYIKSRKVGTTDESVKVGTTL